VQAAESIYQVAEAADESTLSQHALTFKHLVGNKHPEARVAAVKALGRLRNLDDVPTLLYAISDPDTRVVIAAVDALRYISRQPYGSPGTVVTDAASRDAALDYWKRWYRTIRPDADLSGLSP
jgi:HEAT repeat protein